MLNNLVIGTVLINILAFSFVVLRARIYGMKLYRPMLLNIGLSIFPIFVLIIVLVATIFLSSSASDGRTLWVSIPGYIVVAVLWLGWLLMLPNSSYLITELNFSHRDSEDPVPLWFDIILVLSLAMSGVFNMVINIFVAQIVYGSLRYPDQVSWSSLQQPGTAWLSITIIVLCSLGMYLGRYMRLNSWDVKHPCDFARRLVNHFDTFSAVRNAAGFVAAHTLFIGLVYYIIVGGVIASGAMIDELRQG